MRVYSFNNYYIGTANKKYVKHAVTELKRIDQDLKVIDRFPDGIFTFRLGCYREVFLYNLKTSPPIFLRHVNPIDKLFFIPQESEAPQLAALALTSLSDRIKAGKRISVQARRVSGEYDHTLFTFKKLLDPLIEKEHFGIPTVKRPDQIISVFVTDSTEIDYMQSATCSVEGCPDEYSQPWKAICLMGISTPQENLCQWSGGQVRFAKEEEQASRAEFKLLEAFEVFAIEPAPSGSALDLGSSPGGWARILSQKGYQVTAVDRAPLDKDVQALPGVRFIKRDAQHFRDNPDTYDIITNDMNRDPVQSAKILASLAPALRKGCPFVMTIKLMGNDPEKTIQGVRKILDASLQVRSIRQLFHNRDEVTLWGIRQ